MNRYDPFPPSRKILTRWQVALISLPLICPLDFFKLMQEFPQDYTGFSTSIGSFKWLRMPMGLTGSPPTFQCLVEKVLVGLTLENLCALSPYLDDISIFSSTPEEHLERLLLVLERFRAHNLKISPNNCDFFRMKFQFFGHKVSKKRIRS